MGLWFLALKARKAGNWPRTFYTGLTVLTQPKSSFSQFPGMEMEQDEYDVS